MFLHNTPENWAFQVHMYAYAHNSQPISELNVSPYEIVFHTRPRIPLTFDLNLNRNTSKTCISQYCSQLPEHSHYDKTDLNPFFYKTLSKPIPQWFLAVETAMLQIYSTVYYYTLKKLNSHAYITKTYHEGKPLPIGTFVLKRHFAHVHFSDKLKPLRIGPYKILDRLSDVTYELLAQDGSTLHVHRNHLIPYYPKEPLLYPHLRNFMRFSDSINFDIPNPFNMLIATHHLLIPMNPFLTIHPFRIMTNPYHQTTFLHKHHQILIHHQQLTYPFNQFLKPLVLITPVTELVTNLKINLHHLLLQIIEIQKLIIT